MTVRDDLAVAALAKALVRTGMYVDAGIDTSAGLDKPQVYAAAILNDPDLAADGLHFVMVETLERAATPTASPTAREVRRLVGAANAVYLTLATGGTPAYNEYAELDGALNPWRGAASPTADHAYDEECDACRHGAHPAASPTATGERDTR